MKRKITQWTLTMVLAISLVACATSVRYTSTYDDIYYSPKRTTTTASIVKTTETTEQDAEIQQLKLETQAAIRENAKRLTTDSTIVVYEEDNSYRSVVSDSYEDSYERRLRGYNSPSYGTESVIRITTSSDWMLVSSFDPAFYNIIIMGDEIWVEPKYITSMFSPVRTTINLGWGYGSYWNSWNYPRFGFGWNWHNSWYSWYNPWSSWYSPWSWSSWHYPYYGSYWGWNYGCGWNYGWNGNWGYRYNNNHWGLGRPSSNFGNTYNRRTSGTLAQNRVSSANTNNNNRLQDVTSSTRRGTRNMEMVSNRYSSGSANTSTNVNAGNRRGNAVGNTTGNNSTQRGNTTGVTTRDVRNTGISSSRLPQQNGTTNVQTQDGRRNSQVYTRPATASRQNYNESSVTSGTARRNVTGSATTVNPNTGTTRVVGTSPSSSGNSSRSVSTSRYTTSGSSSSGTSSNSSSSVSRSSSTNSSSSSSVSRSSSSSSSSSSYSPSSSSSSRSSGSSSSGSSSSSSGGGSRRR